MTPHVVSRSHLLEVETAKSEDKHSLPWQIVVSIPMRVKSVHLMNISEAVVVILMRWRLGLSVCCVLEELRFSKERAVL